VRRLLAGLLTLAALAALAWRHGRPPSGTAASDARLRMMAGPDAGGFARATAVRDFLLPLDHGPHPDYQTEWWYYTGNLEAEGGGHWGYQLTFFRRGLSPGGPPDDGGLATNQIYFAHLALTDAAGKRHHFAERFSRGAGGLAGGSGSPFRVWLEDWKAEATNAQGSAVRLEARDADFGLDLGLSATKPLVLHGERGLSAKSEEPGNASYYIGYTRMATSGSLRTADGDVTVTGLSWFDHEWSTSALGKGALGWDWWSLQLDDGRELMFFRIRRKDGSVEPVSGGTLVERDGRSARLRAGDMNVEVLDRWESRETGALYPSRWRLAVPSADLELDVRPWVAGQEMRTSFTYWEGAVRVEGTRAGRPIAGNGYVELTGYAKSMQGVF
jgi:predicted secreted hydrolase